MPSSSGKHTAGVVEALPPLRGNDARAFRKCTMHGNVGWYDYTPYSLSVPIFVMPCGCGKENMAVISEEEFHAISGVPKGGDAEQRIRDAAPDLLRHLQAILLYVDPNGEGTFDGARELAGIRSNGDLVLKGSFIATCMRAADTLSTALGEDQ